MISITLSKLIYIKRFELPLQLYLFDHVIIDTHHTTCNFVHDEVFGAEVHIPDMEFPI